MSNNEINFSKIENALNNETEKKEIIQLMNKISYKNWKRSYLDTLNKLSKDKRNFYNKNVCLPTLPKHLNYLYEQDKDFNPF